jgi:hypothetical protein
MAENRGKETTGMKQELDMQKASFTTQFDHADKASVSYTYYSLRHLPYTVLMDINITAKKDITVTGPALWRRPMRYATCKIIIMKLTGHM